ncbi:MAG TPA: PilZ domain-containing protein [Xanthobacteraceae bacterium]|jgi:hypothetical protein
MDEPVKPTADNQRRSARVRTLKTAKIVFNNRSSVLDCTVRNVSKEGALLLVASPLGIPDVFELTFGPEARQAKVVWRQENRLAVEFI